MITFLPFPNAAQSARVLDRQRLGKQRVETLQILKANRGETTGWKNHPATRMWYGYDDALIDYGIAMCREWMARGYSDSLGLQFIRRYENKPIYPDWFGREDIHRSHRSQLIRKLPYYYRDKLGWTDPNDIPYVWPV